VLDVAVLFFSATGSRLGPLVSDRMACRDFSLPTYLRSQGFRFHSDFFSSQGIIVN
jgi:hypothetical protein